MTSVAKKNYGLSYTRRRTSTVNQHFEKTLDDCAEEEETWEERELDVFTCMICSGGYEDDEIATLPDGDYMLHGLEQVR